MGYVYNGKIREIRPRYTPFSQAETRAKFAYFREAETHIYLGPAPETQIRARRPQPICGTYSGWAKHRRDNTPKCRDCMDAHTIYQRQYRAKKRQAA